MAPPTVAGDKSTLSLQIAGRTWDFCADPWPISRWASFHTAWIKIGNRNGVKPLRVHPRQRTSLTATGMSEKCQNRKSLSSFDHLVGADEDSGRHGESKCSGGFQVDDQLNLRRLLDRQF